MIQLVEWQTNEYYDEWLDVSFGSKVVLITRLTTMDFFFVVFVRIHNMNGIFTNRQWIHNELREECEWWFFILSFTSFAFAFRLCNRILISSFNQTKWIKCKMNKWIDFRKWCRPHDPHWKTIIFSSFIVICFRSFLFFFFFLLFANYFICRKSLPLHER